MKIPWAFLQLPVRFDAAALAAEVEALGDNVWRPHPNGLPGNDALTLVTVEGDPESDEMWGPMEPTPHLKACPYLMQVMAAIGSTWGRSRLMRLSGQAEVTPHVDTNYYWAERMRVHVPIVTQPTVRFMCGTDEINMAAGDCWIFDTWRMHRVLNDDSRARIHLVADTVGGETLYDLIHGGRPHDRPVEGWRADFVAPSDAPHRPLDFESQNAPLVMTPWEVERHVAFILGEADGADPRVAAAAAELQRFLFCWRALWARYGEAAEGKSRYESAITDMERRLAAGGANEIRLRNGVKLMVSVIMLIAAMALRPARGPKPTGPQPMMTPDGVFLTPPGARAH